MNRRLVIFALVFVAIAFVFMFNYLFDPQMPYREKEYYTEEHEYFLNINKDCRCSLTLEKENTLIRTILSGACIGITAEEYIKSIQTILLKEKIAEKAYDIEIFYVKYEGLTFPVPGTMPGRNEKS